MIRAYRAAVLAGIGLSMLAAGGCGFQLGERAPSPTAIQPLHVQCGEGVPVSLCDSIRGRLDRGGVSMSPDSAKGFPLTIRNYQSDRRASAITLEASAAEFTVRQRVELHLSAPEGTPLLSGAELRASDSYRFDESNVLAKRREQKELEERLHERLAEQVIQRLSPLTEERIRVIRERAQHKGNGQAHDDQAP